MAKETDEIKQRLDLVEVVQEYLPLKKSGANFKANCPFHQESSPSFMVSQSKQIWHCFGCHEGGDVFSFVQKIEGVDFYESLKILGEKAGVKIVQKNPEANKKKEQLLSILEVAAEFYHKILLDHPKAEEAREYFKGRGVTEETIKTFQLGYSPDAWDTLLKFLLQRGYSQQAIIDAGLVVYQQEKNRIYDRFRHRVMIPLRDVYGAVVGFTARAIGEDYSGGKYINSPQSDAYDKSQVVFGLSFAKKAIKNEGYVVIVEGNMDVIASHQVGVLPVVAVSGTALTESQLRLLKRFTQTTLFAFDADAAGILAARRGVELALQQGMDVKVLTIPAGKDPDDCIREDVNLWKTAIKEAKPVIEYLIDLGVKQHNVATPEGKKAVAEDLKPLLKMLPNSVDRGHYIQKLASEIGVSLEMIREMMKAPISQSAKKSVPDTKAEPIQQIGPNDQAIQEILALILCEQSLYAELGELDDLIVNSIHAPLYKHWKLSYDNLVNKGSDQIDTSLLFIDSESGLQTVFTRLQLFADKEFADLTPQQCREAFMARKQFLMRRALQGKLQTIQQAIKQAEQIGDKNKLNDLYQDFQLVSNDLMKIQ